MVSDLKKRLNTSIIRENDCKRANFSTPLWFREGMARIDKGESYLSIFDGSAKSM
jgi:hypothetical protein